MSEPESAWNRIMQYSFLVAFANDGTIDADELAFIQRLALEDGVVDEDERHVLGRIFSRVGPDMVTPEVWAEIRSFCDRFGIE